MLELHLNSCSRCRQRLHELSAENEVWEKVVSDLQHDVEVSAKFIPEQRGAESESTSVKVIICLTQPISFGVRSVEAMRHEM